MVERSNLTPGALVELLAGVLGVPAERVVVIDRALAQAGLRSVGGRGPSAARVTSEDAAVLLLTVMAAGTLTRADETARIWTALVTFGVRTAPPPGFEPLFPKWPGVFLHDALASLIRLPPTLYKDGRIQLKLSLDVPLATLRVAAEGRHTRFDFLPRADLWDETMKRAQRGEDLVRTAEVSEVTISALHDGLFPESSKTKTP